MKPSKFAAYQERRLGRLLTKEEKLAIDGARADAHGKRVAVKDMWAALRKIQAEVQDCHRADRA